MTMCIWYPNGLNNIIMHVSHIHHNVEFCCPTLRRYIWRSYWLVFGQTRLEDKTKKLSRYVLHLHTCACVQYTELHMINWYGLCWFAAMGLETEVKWVLSRHWEEGHKTKEGEQLETINYIFNNAVSIFLRCTSHNIIARCIHAVRK